MAPMILRSHSRVEAERTPDHKESEALVPKAPRASSCSQLSRPINKQEPCRVSGRKLHETASSVLFSSLSHDNVQESQESPLLRSSLERSPELGTGESPHGYDRESIGSTGSWADDTTLFSRRCFGQSTHDRSTLEISVQREYEKQDVLEVPSLYIKEVKEPYKDASVPSVTIQECKVTYNLRSKKQANCGASPQHETDKIECPADGKLDPKTSGTGYDLALSHSDTVTSEQEVSERRVVTAEDLAEIFELGLFGKTTRCPAMRIGIHENKKCTRSAGKIKRNGAREILDKLLQLDLHPENRLVEEYLCSLALLLICGKHHRDQAQKIAKNWVKRVDFKTPRTPKTVDKQVVEQRQQGLRFSIIQVKTEVNGITTLTHALQMLSPYANKQRKADELARHLNSLIKKELSESDAKSEGFIYIYSTKGSFGHLKIGRTGDVQKRLKEWERQCGHDLELAYPKGEQVQRIPHIKRLEAIIHEELRDHRLRELRCHKCGRSHKEWFKQALPDALAVVEKWSNWMLKQPYKILTTEPSAEKSKKDKTPGWRGCLKDEQLVELPKLLEQAETQPQLSPPRQRPASRRRSSPGGRAERSRSRSSNSAGRQDANYAPASFSPEFLRSNSATA